MRVCGVREMVLPPDMAGGGLAGGKVRVEGRAKDERRMNEGCPTLFRGEDARCFLGGRGHLVAIRSDL